MFKWSKRRAVEEPSTPKLSSVSLPEETPEKLGTRRQWMADMVRKPNPPFPDKAPDQRLKSRSAAHDVLTNTQPPMKGLRAKLSQVVDSDDVLKPPKPSKPLKPSILDEDEESSYLSSREGKQRTEKRPSSKDGVPLKGILKPPKSFKEQDYTKPVIPISSHPEKGGPHQSNEAGAGFHPSAMEGGGKPPRTHTSQDATYPKYRQGQPPYTQGALNVGIPITHPGYPSRGPAIPSKSPYYPEPTQPAFAHPEKPFIPPPPQNPSRAPSYHKRSSRAGDWGGLSDTEGPPRASYSSRHAGGMQSDTEDILRSRSSRYGSGIVRQDSQRAMYQAIQQPPYGYDRAVPHRAATYPVYPVPNNVSPTHYFQDHYSRPRNYSFSGQEITGPPRPPVSSKYVKPHYNSVPQKEEAVSLSWPLLDWSKRQRQRQPALFFDIAFNPSEYDVRYGIRALNPGESIPRPISEEELNTPASSHCVLKEMTIVCEERELGRWSLTARRTEGLRCIDVFQAIYEGYHTPLTSREKRELGDCIQRSELTFHSRCKDSPGLELKNRERGMCRVDLLRSKRVFKGLTRKNGHWILEVEKPR